MTVRIYLEGGLVSHVAGPNGITVRIIDLETEGALPRDLTRLTAKDRRLYCGNDAPARAYIRSETTEGELP